MGNCKVHWANIDGAYRTTITLKYITLAVSAENICTKIHKLFALYKTTSEIFKYVV